MGVDGIFHTFRIMKKWVLIIPFLLLSVMSFSQTVQADGSASLTWHTIEEAVLMNDTAPKKIFIDVYTNWCGWCKVMDKNTFSHPVIAGILNQYFYTVRFNAEQQENIQFKGKVYKGGSGTHELALELLNNKMSYPTVVYMDESLNIIQAIPGYYKPEDIEPILVYFGSGAYKNTPWENFQKNFKSGL